MGSLIYLIAIPLVAAFALVFVPRSLRVVFHLVALLATFASLVLAGGIFWSFQPGVPGPQFEVLRAWAPTLGLNYHFGVDGLNVGLVLMASLVGFAAACVSWDIRHREKEFFILLLVMVGGILGAFASLDLFSFYFFHELALIPTFIMIGVWGRGDQKNYATFQMALYLSVGALLVLLGLIALYVQAGAQSFDIVQITQYLQAHPISPGPQRWIFGLLFFGFGILVSLWPFHTWAPLGYASAPTATAMLHAGVLKKFGLLGLIRIAVPLLPQGAHYWLGILAYLCLGNILYCGLVAMRQRDLNFLLGNSSVAHVGFAFLGIASLSVLGLSGAIVVMIAHGFLAALSFGLSGYLYQQTGNLEMDRLGGLVKRLPFIGTAFILAMLAGCGLPGFINFIGEALVLFGAWGRLPGITILAVWGALVIAAVYMLRAIRRMLHGPLNEQWAALADATNPWRKLPFVLLLTALFLFGCFPRLLTDQINPSAERVIRLATDLPAPILPASVIVSNPNQAPSGARPNVPAL